MRLESGIRVAQVGYPLPNGLDSVRNCVSCDRLTLAAVGSVAHGKDEEVQDLVFLLGNMMEGDGDGKFSAECGPEAEGGGLCGDTLAGVGSTGVLQSRAECSLEAISLGRWSSCQGVGCGYACSK